MARRRALRGSESEHRVAFERSLKKLDRELLRVESSLRKGDCSTAYTGMVWAARAEERANAEANWAGVGYPSSLQRRVSQYDKLTSKFHASCMRRK